MEKNIVVSHGDLDGIVSAVCAVQKFGLAFAETKIVFVQPFTVDRVQISEEMEKVYVVDVAVNNRDPQMTKDFIRRIGDKLVRWYDHHQGWTPDLTENRSVFVIDTNAGSCAEIIGGDPQLVADAIAADTRKGELSPRAQLIEQSMKANIVDDTIRLLAVKWLLGDEKARGGLEVAAKKYAEIQAETERLAAIYQVTGKVALVDARQSNYQRYDLTQLLLAGQKLAPFAIALTTTHPQLGEGETVVIATSRNDIDLVKLFGLSSGALFRVFLPAQRLEEALEKLQKL